MSNEEICVIKVLKPVAKRKIKREIKILRNLAGGPNIVGLLDVVHDPPSRSHSLIMEFVENVDWKQLYPTFTELEIKHYVFQLITVSDRYSAASMVLCSDFAARVGTRICPLERDHAPRCETGECHVRPGESKGESSVDEG